MKPQVAIIFFVLIYIKYITVGQEASVGEWARVEGTPSDPDPNKPFAKMDNTPLFNNDGRLNPSITILGKITIIYTRLVFNFEQNL